MGNIFKGREVVEIGIQIEKNGRDFYSKMAARSGEPVARNLFEYLAGEEEKHIAVFQGMLDEMDRYEEPESYPGEYLAYMSDLAGEHVFAGRDKGVEAAKRITDDGQAIDFGIGIEKDSIVFYLGMKRVVSTDDHYILDKLILEEQKHLEQLIGLKKDIKL